MDSIEKRNSITYDAEKDELKIITYYDERRYKEIWVRDLQIGFLKYMMQTWDLKIRNSWLAIILALWGVYWLIIIGVTLYVLVLFLRSPSFGFILIFAFLIYLWFSAITFRKYWLKKGIQAAQSDDFFKAKKLGPTMAAIENAFEKTAGIPSGIDDHPRRAYGNHAISRCASRPQRPWGIVYSGVSGSKRPVFSAVGTA